jgi:hypothetical protein
VLEFGLEFEGSDLLYFWVGHDPPPLDARRSSSSTSVVPRVVLVNKRLLRFQADVAVPSRPASTPVHIGHFISGVAHTPIRRGAQRI